MVLNRHWFSPDQFLIIAFIPILLYGGRRKFLADWTPAVGFYLGYEYLRDLVPSLARSTVHITEMINFDKFLFGSVPTIYLQKALFDGTIRWYDFLLSFFYISHFIVPFFVAFLFWLLDRGLFRVYMISLVLVSYLSFITYLTFPAMPPWMAAERGFLPPVARVFDLTMAHLGTAFDIPTIYSFFGANPVAAVPSLHAAFPMLVFLFVAKRFKFWAILALPYVLGVWFSAVYFGEHYVFDVLVGAAYSVLIFWLIAARPLFLKLPKLALSK